MLNKARRLDVDAEHNGLLGTNVANFMATHGNVMYDFIGSTPVPVGFRPYTFYTKVVPLNFDKYVDVMPGDNFVQQDDNSSFLDENFDETENEAYVPKLYGEYNG